VPQCIPQNDCLGRANAKGCAHLLDELVGIPHILITTLAKFLLRNGCAGAMRCVVRKRHHGRRLVRSSLRLSSLRLISEKAADEGHKEPTSLC
jgi:hypothetical protein